MENKQANTHGTGNGFLLGVIVGILATLLFTTKKGRRVLQTLTDHGMEKFSEIETKLQSAKQEFADEIEEEDDYVEVEERTPAPEPKPEKKILARAQTHTSEPVEHHAAPAKTEKEGEKGSVKKFFRIKKS